MRYPTFCRKVKSDPIYTGLILSGRDLQINYMKWFEFYLTSICYLAIISSVCEVNYQLMDLVTLVIDYQSINTSHCYLNY